MRALKAIGGSIKNFMILFSFIVNLVLVVVLIVLGLTIFEIKNQIAAPLVSGLHSSFVGLDQATIDWTIPVRADVPVNLDIALQQNTAVVLTAPVPLNVTANITLPGVGVLNNANVALTLPQGLVLPVALNLNVPVRDSLPIALDVRAVIPLDQTQLHDPFANLQLMFDPLARILTNLPDGFDQVPAFIADALDADGVDLLADNAYTARPWPGFSRTAGLDYELADEPVPPENRPLLTGIVPIGGIPILDALLRPELYARGGPAQVNEAARAALDVELAARERGAEMLPAESGGPNSSAPGEDMGIMPTPVGSG